MLAYYAEPGAKLPVIPWNKGLLALTDGDGIEARFLTDGLANTFSDNRLSWVPEKEGGIPPEFCIEGLFFLIFDNSKILFRI